ncbi:hypothetical protein J416_02906 [Gracilibacillus halophilus YIM-C55.5]|uniref:Uncharacterized protein n=1 Tax=Gracilibacillus halophilus YIM-C55.5 TaxID=1308866 RepID=N4WXY2_9BACI|nr:hypothetical protein J416_02906 [Gracilibacillus halophilus YIM-C55.5]
MEANLKTLSLIGHFNRSILNVSNKGNHYEDTFAESRFKAIKIEFMNGSHFINQQDLDLE